MSSLWRSARLIYRKCTENDDHFLTTLQANADDYTHEVRVALVPPGQKDNDSLKKKLAEALLGVVVCLPARMSDPGDDNAEEDGPTPIGILFLDADDRAMGHHRHGHHGIWIASAYQRRGYGTEVVLWTLSWAFRMLNLHRVDLDVFEWNPGAIRLYEKLGFKREGRMREHLWFNGRYWDQLLMGMLQHEWHERYGDEAK